MTQCCDIGLWIDLGTATPPSGCGLIQTSGYDVEGAGFARYTPDSDQTSIIATRWRRQDANGLWWLLAETNPDAGMFGAKGDGATDDSAALQASLDYAYASGKPLALNPGTFLVTQALTYLSTQTLGLFSSGPVIRGAGMGKTVMLNRVEDDALFTIGRAVVGGLFTKGGEISNMTIVGDAETPGSTGLRLRGAWYMLINNVRIIDHTDVGIRMGDDPEALNPDFSATAGTTIMNCEIERNRGGIDNPVNNNAPDVAIINTQIRTNRQFGIWMNSSYWDIDETSSVSFNGFLDYENAAGGIIISERQGTNYSAGYRAKAFVARCELDTNYPWSLDFRQAELPIFKGGGIQFRDYPGTEIALIPQWPEGAVRIGGSQNLERCLGAKLEDVRISIVNDGQIPGGPSGAIGGKPFAWLVVEEHGISVESSHHAYNLEGVAVGTDCVFIREKPKASQYDDRLLYAKYDLPLINGASSWAATGFDVPYPIIFGAVRQTVPDDTAITVQTPLLGDASHPGANYGAVVVSVGGAMTASDLLFYRATTSPTIARAGASSSSLNLTTGALAGTTGTDGKYTVSVDDAGLLYFENRIGGNANVQIQFVFTEGAWGTYPSIT